MKNIIISLFVIFRGMGVAKASSSEVQKEIQKLNQNKQSLVKTKRPGQKSSLSADLRRGLASSSELQKKIPAKQAQPASPHSKSKPDFLKNKVYRDPFYRMTYLAAERECLRTNPKLKKRSKDIDLCIRKLRGL